MARIMVPALRNKGLHQDRLPEVCRSRKKISWLFDRRGLYIEKSFFPFPR